MYRWPLVVQTKVTVLVGFARSYFAVSARSRCASRPTRNCERQNTDIGFIAVCRTVGNSGNNFLI